MYNSKDVKKKENQKEGRSLNSTTHMTVHDMTKLMEQFELTDDAPKPRALGKDIQHRTDKNIRRHFAKYYLPYLSFDVDNLTYTSIDKDKLVNKADKMKQIVASIDAYFGRFELGYSNPSDFGTHASLTTHTVIKKLLPSLWVHVRHKNWSEVVIADIGCGQNRVCWLLGQHLGCKTIGIEACPHRTKLAADAASCIIRNPSELYPAVNTKVALIFADATIPANWRSVDIFFCFDLA